MGHVCATYEDGDGEQRVLIVRGSATKDDLTLVRDEAGNEFLVYLEQLKDIRWTGNLS